MEQVSAGSHSGGEMAEELPIPGMDRRRFIGGNHCGNHEHPARSVRAWVTGLDSGFSLAFVV